MNNYSITTGETTITLNKSDLQLVDIISVGKKSFHILQDGKAFSAELVAADFKTKTMTVQVNGNKYQLSIEDEYDQLVKKMGLSVANQQKIKEIKAPMPGLVLDILIEPGQAVNKGDALLILEAMKMENVLKSAGEGVVKSIEIEKGDAVDKGQIMIEME